MNTSDDLEMEDHNIAGSNFSYSAMKTDDLDATEYTIVTIVADRSGSVYQFYKEMEKCVGKVVEGCAKSPRKDNLLVRYVTFDSKIEEVHGFKNLKSAKADDYTDTLDPRGCTVLHDAAYNTVQASAQMGADLQEEGYDANAIVIVITDGEDNGSTKSVAAVQQAIGNARRSENLESIKTILVGVGSDSSVDRYLQHLQGQWGFDEYVNIGDANASNIAKLCDFVSKSISSTSASLGSGNKSVSLSFN